MYINVYFTVVNNLLKIYFSTKVIILLFPNLHLTSRNYNCDKVDIIYC